MSLWRLQQYTGFWQRRAIALLMLVLHLGVSLAPMAEREGRRGTTHAERPGTRHAQMHNEETCATCAVRSVHSAAPNAIAAVIAKTERSPMISARRAYITSHESTRFNGTRAPPTIG